MTKFQITLLLFFNLGVASNVLVYFEIESNIDKTITLQFSDIYLYREQDSLKLKLEKPSLTNIKVQFPQQFIARGHIKKGTYNRLGINLNKIKTYAGSAEIEPKIKNPNFSFLLESPITGQTDEVLCLKWKIVDDSLFEHSYQPSIVLLENPFSYQNAMGVYSVPKLHYISIFNRNTNKIKKIISTGLHPTGLAYNQLQNKFYVANKGSNSLSILKTPAFDVKTDLPLRFGDGPTKMALNPILNLLYVLNSESNSISIIDTEAEQESDRIQLDFRPKDLEISADLSELYVAGESNYLHVFNTLSHQLLGRINTGSFIQNIKFNNLENEIVLSLETSRQVVFLNAVSKNIIRKSSLCEYATHIEFEKPGRSTLLSIPLCNQISFFKWENQNETGSIRVSGSPKFIAISPDNQYIYALMNNSSIIEIINSNNLKVESKMESGNIPGELIFIE